METSGEVTELLRAWGSGDRGVEERLLQLVLPDMHKVAKYLMAGERADHSLQATALMNEAYMRMVASHEREWENKRHFLAVAARAMRHLLIDHARSRPSGLKLPIDGLRELLRGRDQQLELAVSISTLLDELDTVQPDGCSIVELKYFAGFTDEEVSEALGLPIRTVQRKFADARQWLFRKLGPQ